MKNFLAIDIGASSGRHMLGRVENGKIRLEEIYRFVNSQVRKDGHDCWDLERLVESVKAGIDVALERGPVESLGIDTWGVDFVLLDGENQLCSDAVAYRDIRTEGMDAEVEKLVPFTELYRRTGIQKASYNTIYQLMALKREHPEQLERAAQLMMLPEYLNFALTGNIVHDYTDSSTTALVSAEKRDWDRDLIAKLGLPDRIFGKLSMPGATVGEYKGIRVILPALHDTGSAYLAVPARDEQAVYLSSGTWSLLGIESPVAITGKAAQQANFTNEGGAWGRYRFLRNIMGLWMIQSVRRELNGVAYVEGKANALAEEACAALSDYTRGHDYSFAELSMTARSEPVAATIVNVQDNRFFNPASMIAEVQKAASERGVKLSTIGALMRCIYQSLAECYADSVRTLSEITGRTYTSLNIVGGGCQDLFFNSLIAETTGLEVFAGPVEGSALGNLIVQMIAAGEFADLASARQAIER